MLNKINYSNSLLQIMLILNNVATNVNLVGGCVRDILLGKQPADFDIVLNGDLDTITQTLSQNGWSISESGKVFLVLKASKGGESFDIALYRKDGTYTDGRRPEKTDVGTLIEDAQRRDFTINALYLNPFTNVVLDPTEKGLEDLKNKTIRFVGKAKERILEDQLRILRAYRFCSTLNFSMDKQTLKSCRTYFHLLIENVDSMRIMNEIEKMSFKGGSHVQNN